MQPAENGGAEPERNPRIGARRAVLSFTMLAERDRAVLDFESSWWLHPGPKDRAIREHLGMSATSYYKSLRRLMDDPAAQRYQPLTVRRLRRVRDDGLRRAAARRSGDNAPGT